MASTTEKNLKVYKVYEPRLHRFLRSLLFADVSKLLFDLGLLFKQHAWAPAFSAVFLRLTTRLSLNQRSFSPLEITPDPTINGAKGL
jgi:hypothetical protein